MREIAINGRFLTRRAMGVDRFAYEILAAIDELIEESDSIIEDLEFKIIVPARSRVEIKFRHILIEEYGFFTSQLWEQLDLPRAIGKESILLSLCNTGPIFCRRHVVVIHDAATVRVPTSYSRIFRLWYRILMPLLGMFSSRVLTVSSFSKTDVSSAFGIPISKIDIVSESGEHILRVPRSDSAIQRHRLTKGQYVLAVGSLAAHKNFKLILEAFAKIDSPTFDIAVVGGANLKVFGSAELADSPRLKRLGYVTDSELRALYDDAMCFVFPSFYEGFGLPPLEAMNCGCPVLAARTASIPEVCGDAALYFDSHDADSLHKLLLDISTNATLYDELAKKGRVRAAEFSWLHTARKLIAVCLRD